MKELELWQFIRASIAGTGSAVLLVVVESSGSSPGRRGFKLAVAADGIFGSIGGGVMEVTLVEGAKAAVLSPGTETRPQVIEQVHRKDVPNSSGMICSGKQTVISVPVGAADLPVIEKIIAALVSNERPVLEISERGIAVEEPEAAKFEQEVDGSFSYREPLGRSDRLVVVGGGHCALALSELMSKLGFRITLFDDRAELNTLEKNVFVDEKTIIRSYDEIGDHLPSDPEAFVVVMTLGYRFDEIVIRQLIDRNFRYFGVLGSKAKMKAMLRELENDGLPHEKLARIHAPIGLPINSRTPEEIAVSIAAEIIAVRNGAA